MLNKKKVNVDDLRGWLAETIDKWVQDKVDEIDRKYDEKYKAIILKQKNEIADLKASKAKIIPNTGSTGDKPKRATKAHVELEELK